MGEDTRERLASIARFLLLILLAFACYPCNKFLVGLALLFSHPSLFGLLLSLTLAMAGIGTAIIGAWVLFSIHLNIWTD